MVSKKQNDIMFEELKNEYKRVMRPRKNVQEDVKIREEEELLKKIREVSLVKYGYILKRYDKLKASYDATIFLVNEAIKPYVLGRGPAKVEVGKYIRNKRDAIIKISVDGEIITIDDEPVLFDFLNGGNGLMHDEYSYQFYYYDDPILQKIPSGVEGESLNDLKMKRIEFLRYASYFNNIRYSLCCILGHDWYFMSKDEFGPSAFYHCKNCSEIICEVYEISPNPLPSAKNQLRLMNLSRKIPRFCHKSNFAKIDYAKRVLKPEWMK